MSAWEPQYGYDAAYTLKVLIAAATAQFIEMEQDKFTAARVEAVDEIEALARHANALAHHTRMHVALSRVLPARPLSPSLAAGTSPSASTVVEGAFERKPS